MIDFYTAATPNGYKAATFLGEDGIAYTPHVLQLSRNDQKTLELLATPQRSLPPQEKMP